MIRRYLQYLTLSFLLICLATPSFAQDEEEMSRFFTEMDWSTWQEGILHPDTVKKLFIRDKSPLDYEALKKFRSLEGLIIYESPLPDLKWLSDFPELKILEFQGNTLRSLEGIQVLKNLEEFSCNANFVKDLSPLDSLLKLQMIQVYDNDVESLKPIGHLQNVKHLDVSRNNIRSLKPIENWTNLSYLSVYNCHNLLDISEVENFKKLKHLNISFLDIPDFSLAMLQDHDSLENLRIQGMVKRNSELQYIMHHTQITQLTMGKNDSVTSLDSLRFLVNLKYLDIHSNNVSDISVLRNFPGLIKFVAYRNKIENIQALLNCVELRSLFIHENPISDYSPLFQMGYLQHLSLDRDDFTKIQVIDLKRALGKTDISLY